MPSTPAAHQAPAALATSSASERCPSRRPTFGKPISSCWPQTMRACRCRSLRRCRPVFPASPPVWGGIPELLGGGCGIAVSNSALDFGRGLERLLASPGLRRAFGGASRSRWEALYSVRRMAQAYEALYLRCAGMGGDDGAGLGDGIHACGDEGPGTEKTISAGDAIVACRGAIAGASGAADLARDLADSARSGPA